MTICNTQPVTWEDWLTDLDDEPLVKESLQPQYYDNILQTIGETPLVRLRNVVPENIQGMILAKVESMNPGGSIKDRVAFNMIETAERKGLLKPGGTIIEATSGNTGIGLATVAATKGYKAILVMPDRMSPEKVNYLRALGAEVILAPSVGPEDPRNNVNVAARLAAETPNSFWTNQYKNTANPTAHYVSTGPEIWRQTAGQVKVLVCGMGTGGTISGTGKFLKEQNPDIKVVGVDVRGSLIKESWEAGHQVGNDEYEKGKFMVEGIGKYFIPDTMNLSVVDEIVRLEDKDCFMMARDIAHTEGIFAGGSSGGAVAGAIRSKYVQALKPGEIAVVILPDSGNRYVSRIYNDDWMRENGYMD
ncbi:MAG: cysteine synthase family protein [Anaerolineae bacterium]|jgi:cystathionine beta-synthase|nr:cysteine synthase family protein [Anaerolineae bacterium]